MMTDKEKQKMNDLTEACRWALSALEETESNKLLIAFLKDVINGKPSPEPEMMIQPNGYIHPKNEHCGKYKCVPYVAEAKEKSYAERQAEWVKATGVKVGDKVRVIRVIKGHEQNWNDTWGDYNNNTVGSIFEISKIDEAGIRDKNNKYWHPYFCLEPAPAVKLPEAIDLDHVPSRMGLSKKFNELRDYIEAKGV